MLSWIPDVGMGSMIHLSSILTQGAPHVDVSMQPNNAYAIFPLLAPTFSPSIAGLHFPHPQYSLPCTQILLSKGFTGPCFYMRNFLHLKGAAASYLSMIHNLTLPDLTLCASAKYRPIFADYIGDRTVIRCWYF